MLLLEVSAMNSLVHEYVLDLRRLLEAALDAERDAADELGDLSPDSPAETTAMRSAADRLNAAREWKETINAQLTAMNRL